MVSPSFKNRTNKTVIISIQIKGIGNELGNQPTSTGTQQSIEMLIPVIFVCWEKTRNSGARLLFPNHVTLASGSKQQPDIEKLRDLCSPKSMQNHSTIDSRLTDDQIEMSQFNPPGDHKSFVVVVSKPPDDWVKWERFGNQSYQIPTKTMVNFALVTSTVASMSKGIPAWREKPETADHYYHKLPLVMSQLPQITTTNMGEHPWVNPWHHIASLASNPECIGAAATAPVGDQSRMPLPRRSGSSASKT